MNVLDMTSVNGTSNRAASEAAHQASKLGSTEREQQAAPVPTTQPRQLPNAQLAALHEINLSPRPQADLQATRQRIPPLQDGYRRLATRTAEMTARLGIPHSNLRTEEQKIIDDSALPASMACDVGRALRKANIPINRTTIKDVERFNDEKLTGSMESLVPGNVSLVSKARYGDFTGVFRIPGNGMMSKGVRLIEKSSSPCRDKATYLLDEKLGFGVIPYTAFAVHKNESGNMEAGIIMEFARGTPPALSLANTEVTGSEIGKSLLNNKEELLRDKNLMRIQCKLLGVESIEFKERDRVRVSYNHSPVSLDNPVAKRELIKLQILDFIAEQVDRHSKNYIVNEDPESGVVLGVKGIDNDLSFEKKFKIINTINHHILSRRIIVGLPEFVDKEMCESINKLTESGIKALFLDFLPNDEIDAAAKRLNVLKQYLNANPGRIIDSKNWGDTPFFDKTKSYVARDAGNHFISQNMRNLESASKPSS